MSETDKVDQSQSKDQAQDQDLPIEDDGPIEGVLQAKYKLFSEKEVKIDMKLVTKTSIKSEIAASLSEEEKIDMLLGLKIVHLEWLNIRRIENLDVFTNLESLYLQYNQIDKIVNLDMLINLEYLALNNNQIKSIENLNHFKKLACLNLSNNQIEDFEESELPSNLYMLKLQGNPCCQKSDYLTKIFKRLPELAELDAGPVTPVVRMVGLGKLPAQMLDYSKTVDNINQKGQAKDEEDEEEEEEEEDEDEDGEEESEEELFEDEKDETERMKDIEEQKSLSNNISRALSDDKFRNSTASTAHSRADTDSFYMESKIGAPELNIMREKTEKILQRMKEKYAQQLGDTMKEIQDTRALHEEIIKIYKSQNTKK